MTSHVERPLIISSIAGLWNTYMSDKAAICMFKHFLNNVDDKETKDVIQYALKLSEQHVKEIKEFFESDNIPIPVAFGEADVDSNASRLFTDTFYLFYIGTMAGYGMDAYSLLIRNVARSDVQNFFVKCLNDATDLLLKTSSIQKKKGIYLNAPRVEISRETTFVEKDGFFKGLFREKRPLVAREITNIFAAELIDIFWRALFTGFGQVTKTKEVKDFMFKGVDIASTHFERFSKFLNDEDIPVSSISDSFVTSTTVPPFSDKLMMFHALSVCTFLLGVDGAAIASSMRSDLLSIHTIFGAEIVKYVSEGAEIMVNNRWMEQPMQAINHKNLSTV